jgi:hypothetical protein
VAYVAVALHSNRFFRTFGADKKQKSPAINNLHDLKQSTFQLFLKRIQVVDSNRLVRSFLFEAAPKVRKIRFKCSATADNSASPAGDSEGPSIFGSRTCCRF